MGVYRAVRSDEHKIVLVHEPETTESHVIEIRNPGASYTPNIEEGIKYLVSLSVTRYHPYVPPVEESKEDVDPEPLPTQSDETSA